jgi:hypothetical protein
MCALSTSRSSGRKHCCRYKARAITLILTALLTGSVVGNQIDTTYTSISQQFDFPEKGHRGVRYFMVHFKGQRTSWRACQQHCSICDSSPSTFIFHMDCYNLLKSYMKTPLQYIWLVGSRSKPWVAPSYEDRIQWKKLAVECSMGPLLQWLKLLQSEWVPVVQKLLDLPPELQSLIRSKIKGTILSRFAVVLSQRTQPTESIKFAPLPTKFDCLKLNGPPGFPFLGI